MNSKATAYAAAIASFVIWGFVSFCIKPLHMYASLDVLFFRLIFAASFLSVITFAFRFKNFRTQQKVFLALEKKQRNKTALLTAIGGLLLAANWFFYIYVMNNVSIKTASFAYLVCPILTAILAGILLKEKLSTQKWLAVFLSAVSCTVLGIHSAVELIYSLVVAASYSLYLISQKKNTHLDKFVTLTFQLLFSSLVLLPFFPSYSSQIPTEISFYVTISILASFFTIVPLYFNLVALKHIDSSTMGILLYINPILNFIIAYVYFNESTNPTQWIAYFIILLSVIIFNWKVIQRKLQGEIKKA